MANQTQSRSLDGIRPQKTAQTKRKKTVVPFVKKYRIALAFAIAILVIGILIGLLINARQASLNSLSGEAELQAVEKRVSKHYVLPADEEPALATIADKSKLSSPFFKHVENGDKVLIYQKNQIAIIYRPSIDRIVGVGPVALGSPGSQ